MKHSIIVQLAVLSVVIFIQPQAMTVKPYIDPKYLWDYLGEPVIKAKHAITLEIRMDNNDGFSRVAVSMPLVFYGTDGVTEVTHMYIGAYGSTHSIILQNGFEKGGFFDIFDSTFEFSWDGNLPDTMNFTGSGTVGWPSGLGLQTYIGFHMIIEQEGTFCIDSGSIPNQEPAGRCDWLFDNPVPAFGGPYCWGVMDLSCGVSEFSNCPSGPLTGTPTAPFSYDFNMTNIITYCSFDTFPHYNIEYGPGTIEDTTGYWTYLPNIAEVGDTLGLWIDGNYLSGRDYCFVSLIVKSSCGDINNDANINILDISYLISYLYRGGQAPQYPQYADVDNTGNMNILDVSYLVGYLYKGGPLPNCPSAK